MTSDQTMTSQFKNTLNPTTVVYKLSHEFRAQFEDDALQDVQPVQFIVKDRIQWPMAVTHCSSLITNTSYHIEETDAGLRGLSIRELLLK